MPHRRRRRRVPPTCPPLVQPSHPASPPLMSPKAAAQTPVHPSVAAAAAAREAPTDLTHVSAVLTPPQVYETAVAAGVHKDHTPLPKLFLMGIASGM